MKTVVLNSETFQIGVSASGAVVTLNVAEVWLRSINFPLRAKACTWKL